jgi:outer membrane protein assembly factor BamB
MNVPLDRTRNQPRHLAGVAAFALTLTLLISSSASASPSVTGNTASSWTVYHGNPEGTGIAASISRVSTAQRRWTSPSLDGQLYGEPLVDGDAVFVATENDSVYALSSSTGRIVWRRHLAEPVPSSALPCGNISPNVGITGTPVIDDARKEIFVVADAMVHNHPQHIMVGLALSNGAIQMRRPIDPPGSDPAALLERTGLNLDGNRVVFAMGGNYGDCAFYRGRVISVASNGTNQETFTVDASPTNSQGSIWMGGAAPVVDASGNVWVTTGNGSVTASNEPYDDSDGLLELSASLLLLQYFAPRNWPSNHAADLDMSASPVLLGSNQVLLAGKSGIAYLLNEVHLGGVGNAEASLSVCKGNIDGGSTLVGAVAYLPCEDGIVALRVGPGTKLHVQWQSSVSSGPAIYAARLIWTIGQDGVLYGLDPATGTVRQSAALGAEVNHFPTPAIGDGLLLAPSTTHVIAFRTST